jgi:hypothetical protein
MLDVFKSMPRPTVFVRAISVCQVLSALLIIAVSNIVCPAINFTPGPFSTSGRYLVFSTDKALLSSDQNEYEDVYRYDRQGGGLVLVSLNSTGTNSGNADAYSPVTSADGSIVAFVSDASDMLAVDQNLLTDVFVRDLTAGVTTLVSLNAAGTNGGNDRSFRPQLSADGRLVVFESRATDLTGLANANDDATDVFFHDRVTGVTSLVSVNQTGTASGDRGSSLGTISADGSVVAFESNASDLASEDTNVLRDVFTRRLATGVTTLVSARPDGVSGNADSFDPVVNSDGTIVAFGSSASDLVTGDNNANNDIFVRHLTNGVTTLASINAGMTGSGNGNSYGLQLSAAGNRVAFASAADDLTANDDNGVADVFVRDLVGDTTTLVSVNQMGSGSANGASEGVALSANGRMVTFVSAADDLTTNAVDGLPNLFVSDLVTGVTRLASVNHSGGGSGNNPAFFHQPILCDDGTCLAFRSLSTDLVATNVGDSTVFLFNVLPAATPATLVLFFACLPPNGANEPGVELSCVAEEQVTVEYSHDLAAWLPLSEVALPGVTVSRNDSGGRNRWVLTFHETVQLPYFFRLARPGP